MSLSEVLGYDFDQKPPRQKGYHLLKKGESLNPERCQDNHNTLIAGLPRYQCTGKPFLMGLCRKHAIQLLQRKRQAVMPNGGYGEGWIQKDIESAERNMALHAERTDMPERRRRKLHRQAKARRDELLDVLDRKRMEIRAMQVALYEPKFRRPLVY